MGRRADERTVVGSVPAPRDALAFAWGVTAAVFLLVFVGTLVVAMLVLAPVSVQPDSTAIGVRWDDWASAVSLVVAVLVATAVVTAGGVSGLVWSWAELRVVTRDGRLASWPRRAARPALVSAVVLGCLLLRHDLLGLLAAAALVLLALGTALLAPDRRGAVERLLGIADVGYAQVPASPQDPVPGRLGSPPGQT